MKNKNILLPYTVAYSAINLLHMERNGMVARTTTTSDKGLDIPKEEVVELAKAVKQLEAAVMFILKRIKLSKEDIAYIEKRDAQIIDAFFQTSMLSTGVSPHILFSCVLFSYFTENTKSSISPHFKKLSQQSLYDNIFEKIEKCEIVDWNAHMEATSKILKSGLGAVI
jgi:hypothetical protein